MDRTTWDIINLIAMFVLAAVIIYISYRNKKKEIDPAKLKKDLEKSLFKKSFRNIDENAAWNSAYNKIQEILRDNEMQITTAISLLEFLKLQYIDFLVSNAEPNEKKERNPITG
jgi:hypothetical protein